MTDHIDTAAEREKLAAVLSETYLRCESCNEDMNCHDPSVMWLHRGKPICDNCADESEIPAEELDSAPDPVRVAARLLDALDAERARVEEAEAERSQAIINLGKVHRVVDQVAAERDQALARLAAAYKAADICALTPADAEAALQRVVDAAWNEAVEACARACALMPDALPASPRMAFEAGLTACEAHILALKRPEASHE